MAAPCEGSRATVGSVFGLSLGEFVVVILVAMVVMGPKELPKLLRKAGEWAGKLRRMAAEMRAQSGIDDALRAEGLDLELSELRKLARGELAGVVSSTRAATRFDELALPSMGTSPSEGGLGRGFGQEYPRSGADSYGAIADTAIVDDSALPPSELANDPVYCAVFDEVTAG